MPQFIIAIILRSRMNTSQISRWGSYDKQENYQMNPYINLTKIVLDLEKLQQMC